jgi:hypothetical protein
MKRRFAFALTVLVAVAFVLRAETPSAAGRWEGSIELPYPGVEFRFRELTGDSIRFAPDAKGKVDEILVVQPDGVYKGRRKP